MLLHTNLSKKYVVSTFYLTWKCREGNLLKQKCGKSSEVLEDRKFDENTYIYNFFIYT